jgi:hypothetical protein
MSSPIQPSGTSTPSSARVSVSAENSRPATRSTGRRSSLAAGRQDAARRLEPLLLAQRVADLAAARLEERKAHRAADQDPSALWRNASSTPILSVTLAPPTTATSGRSGLEDARQRRHLALEQAPGRARQQLRDASVEAWARCAAPNASLT